MKMYLILVEAGTVALGFLIDWLLALLMGLLLFVALGSLLLALSVRGWVLVNNDPPSLSSLDAQQRAAAAIAAGQKYGVKQ